MVQAKKFFFVACVIQILAASPVRATVYYVSNSAGSDTNNGTSTSSPWKTLSKINSRTFFPGDTVLFKRGDTWSRQNLKINSSGQSGQPITFAAYGTGDRPKFDGSYEPSAFFGVYVASRSWIVFDNLYVYRFSKGLWIEQGSNITMKNSRVSHIGGECVRLKKNATNVTIQNTEVHDCGVTENGEGIYVGTDAAQAGGVPDRTTNVTIKGNRIYNTGNEAIDLKSGSSNCVVQDNVIHNASEGYNGAIHAGIWSNPLIVPNYTIASNTIYNITGNGGHGIVVKSGGISIYKNIIYNSSQYAIQIWDWAGTRLTTKLYNNTLYKNYRGSVQIMNNAIVDNKNNLAWANGSGNSGYDPLFADAPRADFRLCEGVSSPVSSCSGRSKAIDSGVNVGLSFAGTAPDLGALESNSSALVPSAPSNLVVNIQ